MATAIKVQSCSSHVHIFPAGQSVKCELKRMLQDKSNGYTMNLSLISVEYKSEGLAWGKKEKSNMKASYSC